MNIQNYLIKAKSFLTNKTIFQFTNDLEDTFIVASYRILLKPIRVYNETHKIFITLDRYTEIHAIKYCNDNKELYYVKKGFMNDYDEESLYLMKVEDLKNYTIPKGFYYFKLYKNTQFIYFTTSAFDNYYFDDKVVYKFFAQVTDIFNNFEDEILQAFGNGIFDTLCDVCTLKEDYGKELLDKNVFLEMFATVDSIYNTIISMGEPRVGLYTIEDYVGQLLDDNEIKNKKEEERKEELLYRKNDIMQTMRIRQDLLRDFNRPSLEK